MAVPVVSPEEHAALAARVAVLENEVWQRRSGYLTIPQVAQFTGLSQASIRSHIARGTLRTLKGTSGRVLIAERDLDEFVGVQE